jgi:phosphate transport system permease protein
MNNLAWRKLVNGVMLTLTGVCTVVTILVLFVILGCLIYFGAQSLKWDFFTKLPLAPGETGGGLANAIVGSAQIVGLAALIGIPIGFLAGVYLAEYEDKHFASVVRYVADLLNGVPSIVVGILAWTLVVLPMKTQSGLAGSIALAFMLIPIVTRQTEQFLREVPLTLREGL